MADIMKAWQCIGCGRIEAPQNCVGICQDRKVDLVYAGELDAMRAASDAASGHVELLEAVVRRLARTTPRDGEWERSWRALQADARRALARVHRERGAAEALLAWVKSERSRLRALAPPARAANAL